MHFEVVVARELLVAKLTLGHGPVGVVRQLVATQHLLQAERQVAHLRGQSQEKKKRGYCNDASAMGVLTASMLRILPAIFSRSSTSCFCK